MPKKSDIQQLGISEQVISRRLDGATHAEIAQEYGLSESQIQRYLAKVDESIDNKALARREAIRLELSQDNAQGEFMRYIGELNRRYEGVKDSRDMGDRQEATAILRLLDGAIDKYLKITGLYRRAEAMSDNPKLPDRIDVNWVGTRTCPQCQSRKQEERAFTSTVILAIEQAELSGEDKVKISDELLKIVEKRENQK